MSLLYMYTERGEKSMTPHEEAQYCINVANQLREQATDLLEEAQRLTKRSKELIRMAVLEEAAA